MYKKDAVCNSGFYKENFADDYDLWLRMVRDYKFGNLQENLILLRKHNTNLSNIKSENFNFTKYGSLSKYYNKSCNKNNFYFNSYCYFFNKSKSKNPYQIFFKIVREIFKTLMLIQIKII